MALDFTTYQPPGIYTEDLGGPQLAVRSTVPTAVAIFGRAVGYETYRESIKIRPDEVVAGDTVGALSGSSSTTPPTLAKSGIQVVTGTPVGQIDFNIDITAEVTSPVENPDDETFSLELSTGTSTVPGDLVYLIGQTKASENGLYRYTTVSGVDKLVPVVDTFRVINPTTGVAYYAGQDYVVEQVPYDGEDGTTTRDNKYAIRRVPGGGILPGKVVQVIYRHTDTAYYEVRALYDYDDVRDLYGEPFNADGTIRSEVTLAAKFAFMNGASQVLTCAVDPDMVDEDTDEQLTIEQCYAETLNKFLDQPQAAILVPANGSDYLYPLVKSHVEQQSEMKFERRAILGFDGSAGKIASTLRQSTVQTISSKRVAMVSPSQFDYFSPELGRSIKLGGQFVAAAVAGVSVSQIAAMPLTRKTIDGFAGPTVEDTVREGEKSTESSVGLMVVEKTRRGLVQVRHGVTTDPTDLLTAEWSIIGQQDVMVYRIRDYLEADGLIGMPIYDTTLIQVKASAEAALVSLVRDQVIVGHKNLKVRQLATHPDVVEVRYEWRPAYPLNYILVRYSVEVMTGDVTPSAV